MSIVLLGWGIHNYIQTRLDAKLTCRMQCVHNICSNIVSLGVKGRLQLMDVMKRMVPEASCARSL